MWVLDKKRMGLSRRLQVGFSSRPKKNVVLGKPSIISCISRRYDNGDICMNDMEVNLEKNIIPDNKLDKRL